LSSKINQKSKKIEFKVTQEIPTDQFQKKVDEISWWLTMRFSNGVIAKGQTSANEILPYLGIPENLEGKRVLDIGCSDGYFSFLAEQRGAEVTAIDAFPTQGFQFAHSVLDSKVKFYQMGVYDINPEKLGMFDLVFYLGVQYHIKHPTIPLEKIASVTKDQVIVESAVLTDSWTKKLSVMQFYEHDRPGNDITQYWLSSTKNLLELVRLGGFPKINLFSEFFHPQRGNRAVMHGFKTEKTRTKFLSDNIVIRIDVPKAETKLESDIIEIKGWAIDFKIKTDDYMEDLEVFLDDFDEDGRIEGKATLNVERLDVSKNFNVTKKSGFQFSGKLSNVEKGAHKLYVCLYTESGWNYCPLSIKI